MSASQKTLVFLLVLPALSIGIFFERDHCDVEVRPSGNRDPAIREFIVPPDCSNGTFRWDYPKRTVKLYFANPYFTEMSVCVRDDMLGTIFTVRDVTHTFGMPMVIGEKESCTMKHSGVITLQIDAPDTLYYVGSFIYHIYDE